MSAYTRAFKRGRSGSDESCGSVFILSHYLPEYSLTCKHSSRISFGNIDTQNSFLTIVTVNCLAIQRKSSTDSEESYSGSNSSDDGSDGSKSSSSYAGSKNNSKDGSSIGKRNSSCT